MIERGETEAVGYPVVGMDIGEKLRDDGCDRINPPEFHRIDSVPFFIDQKDGPDGAPLVEIVGGFLRDIGIKNEFGEVGNHSLLYIVPSFPLSLPQMIDSGILIEIGPAEFRTLIASR